MKKSKIIKKVKKFCKNQSMETTKTAFDDGYRRACEHILRMFNIYEKEKNLD